MLSKFPGCISSILLDILLALCMLGNFSCFCCYLLTFFKVNFSGVSNGLTQILICVETVCKGYEQMTKTSLERKEFTNSKTVHVFKKNMYY